MPIRTRQANTMNDLLCCNQLDLTIKRYGRVVETRRGYLLKERSVDYYGCYGYRSGQGDSLDVGPFGWTLNGVFGNSLLSDQVKAFRGLTVMEILQGLVLPETKKWKLAYVPW